jgi:hypothetical protein
VRFLEVPSWVARAKAKSRRKAEGEQASSTPDYNDPPAYGEDGKKKKEKSRDGSKRSEGSAKDKELSDLEEEERKRKEEKKKKKRSQVVDAGAVSSQVSAEESPPLRRSVLQQQLSLPVSLHSSSTTAAPLTNSNLYSSSTVAASSVSGSVSGVSSLSNYAFTFTPTLNSQNLKTKAEEDIVKPKPAFLAEIGKSSTLPGKPPTAPRPEPNPSALLNKMNLSELRETTTTEKTRTQAKTSDDATKKDPPAKKSEFLPPFPETAVKVSPQGVPDDDDKVYMTGFLSKKNERLLGWRKARMRAWKEYNPSSSFFFDLHWLIPLHLFIFIIFFSFFLLLFSFFLLVTGLPWLVHR